MFDETRESSTNIYLCFNRVLKSKNLFKKLEKYLYTLLVCTAVHAGYPTFKFRYKFCFSVQTTLVLK